MDNSQSYEKIDNTANSLKYAKDALNESEEKFRALVEKAGDAIILLQDGKTIYRNPTWKNLIGYTTEETKEKNFLDVVADEDRERVRQYYERRLQGLPAPELYELKINARDGTVLTMEVRPRIITLDGKPATMVVMRDLTERRKAEAALRESEARFRSIFNSVKDCIFIKDQNLRYGMVNPCMLSLFKLEESEVIGKRDEDLFGKAAAEHIRQVDTRVLFGETIEEEHTKPVNGKDTTFHVIKVPIRDCRDSIVGLCGIARNITQRKETEAALVAYHEKLRSLASQLSLAEERERRRISSHVHDHIGQNLAFAKMKLTGLKKQGTPSAQVETIDEICRLISETIQDTRILVSELGSPILYEIGFVPAIKALVTQFADRHGLVLSFQDDGMSKPLSDDIQVLLYRTIRELLTNVVKHAHATHGSVTIRKEGKQIRLEVKDNGVGFEKTNLESNDGGGQGYGLFSIKERLEPLGGRVVVISEKGMGTRTVVTAPME